MEREGGPEHSDRCARDRAAPLPSGWSPGGRRGAAPRPALVTPAHTGGGAGGRPSEQRAAARARSSASCSDSRGSAGTCVGVPTLSRAPSVKPLVSRSPLGPPSPCAPTGGGAAPCSAGKLGFPCWSVGGERV